MNVPLLDIGVQTQALSACRLSIILGVHTTKNRLDSCLKCLCMILNVKKSMLYFHSEPYAWYADNENFKACILPIDTDFSFHFQENIAYLSHLSSPEVSNDLSKQGITHQRLLAINILDGDNAIGKVLLFDDQNESFNTAAIQVALQQVQSLVQILALSEENAQLKEVYEQQSALNFSKTKFFQIIAHDLRAPFHGLLGFSEVLAFERDDLAARDVQEITEYLYDTLKSTYGHIESLLHWAMAEGGRFVYHPINFKLSEVSKIVCNVLTGVIKNKNIEVLDQISADIRLHGDMNMITSILQNLLSNALKFTPADGSGRIVLTASVLDEKVYIDVADNGIGMTADQLSTLFDPQVIATTLGTTGEKGTGLGLVLCKRFTELNHGEISATSIENQGTTIRLVLPAANSAHKILNAVER